MTRVLLTGANGFVGSEIARRLIGSNTYIVRAAVRRSCEMPGGLPLVVRELDSSADWTDVVNDTDVVIHTAARAHIMNDKVADPLGEYRSINVDGTLNLARQAATAGVKRFVFISSIKVNGEATVIGQPYKAHDQPGPDDAYGQSKLEAEIGLIRLTADTRMEVVIIRSPLVYGPKVKGNFASMVRLVSMGVPLPLGAIHNKRSLVGIDNLVDLIVRCIDHPAAANQVFLAGDGEDLSTTELLRGVGQAMGKPARLIPVPAGMLQFGATLLGKRAMAQRLLGSLQVDINKTCELLDWQPPYTVQEGLRRCFERSN